MRAAVIREFGTPDIFRIEEVATPQPGPGHVLVKILAAGVNRFDQYIREGSVVPELSFPHILGADAAGEIADIGEGVEGFRIGERVVPMTGYPNDEADADIHPNSAAPSFAVSGLSRPGSYAQYQEAPARWVVKDETGLPPEQIATLPMAALTAVRALKGVGEVKAGDPRAYHCRLVGRWHVHDPGCQAPGRPRRDDDPQRWEGRGPAGPRRRSRDQHPR